MERELTDFLAGPKTKDWGGAVMRILTARQLLEARQEAEAMGGSTESRGLRSNACLLSRSLYRDGGRMFPDGVAVLEAWSAEAIGKAMEQYDALAEQADPPWDDGKRIGELRQQLAREPEERIRWKVLKAFGVLPSEKRALEMTRGDYLRCALHLMLDRQEQLEALCPRCRTRMEEERCALCGRVTTGEWGDNPSFDREKFEEMKQNG